jgi:hypothetical protein
LYKVRIVTPNEKNDGASCGRLGSVGQAEAGWPGKNDITQGEEDKVTAQTIDLKCI